MKIGSSQQSSARYMADKKEKLPVTGVSMTADWTLLLGFFAVVFIALLIWSWSLFRTVSEESYLKDATQTTARTTVNEAQLDRVTERFEMRRERFETLSGGFVFESASSAVTPVIEIRTASGTAATTTATSSVSTNADDVADTSTTNTP